MTDPTWLDQLTEWAQRNADDDDPAEQLALGQQELLAGVSDIDLVRAYQQTDGTGPVAEALLAVMKDREVDF